MIVLSASVILSSASFSFAAHLSRIAFIWAEASAFVFASFSSAFLALLFDFPVNQSATPCAVPFTMPSAFTWSDSDRFSISSSSVCFLLEVFALPSMFRSSARSLHALPRLHPFPSATPQVPFAGPELLYLDASRCFFRRTPHAHAEDFCTDRLHLDGVKRCGLDTFPGGMVVPVEHYMGMEVRFPYFPAKEIVKNLE